MNSNPSIEPLRVFMITENLSKGGKERRIVELLRHFDMSYPVQIMLVLLKNRVEYEEVYQLKNISLQILHRRIKKDPRILKQVYKLCIDFKPDLIHSWGSMPSIYVFLVAKILKIPFLNGMITNAICKPFSSHWIRAKLTFPFSKLILANSYAGLNAFAVKPTKGRVIHNGFNPDRLSTKKDSQYLRNKYNIESKYIIAMVGAFHPRKDYRTYLNTAEIVCKKRSDVTFLAVGDGGEKKAYEEEFIGNDRIRFTGNIADIESVLSSITIGVLLTNPKVHHEGISNALMEMMAFGKPTIASQGGGNPELIENGTSGILLNENSEDELNHTINSLLDNKALREKIGENAKQRIIEHFSIESMCKNMYQLYQSINNPRQ